MCCSSFTGESFEALTRLTPIKPGNGCRITTANRSSCHGGLFLQLGCIMKPVERFEKLLTAKVPASVRNRAWFYLAKVWYARGYYDRSRTGAAGIDGMLQRDLEAERQHLFANVLMRQGKLR